MEIISVIPRGYCQGVIRAINLTKKTVKENPDQKISMLGMIVHNKYVVNEFEQAGINCLENKDKTRLELLDEINEGIVIITAHGASDEVFAKARSKGLTVVDATCPDVKRTHDLAREHAEHGDVIYLGKHKHPESEGTVGISENIHLVTNEAEINSLGDLKDVLITNQTTLSILDTRSLTESCIRKFPSAKAADEICNATRIRQEAIMKLENVDVLIVVGDPHSNNSNQLKEIGRSAGIHECYLIETCMDLSEEMISGKERVAVTSGSSTPTILTDGVLSVLKNYAETGVFTLPSKLPDSVL